MTWRSPPELGTLLSVLVALSVVIPVARAQDEPETQDMPETVPLLPADGAGADGDEPAERGNTAAASTSIEPEPHVGVRLEAQILGVMSFPFGGKESGSALGFALSYAVGWGKIPILIGIDFMSVGRSNAATSRATIDDADASQVTRKITDRLLDFDLWLRVQPPRWPVRPYAEGFVGAKLIRTNWSIATEDETAHSGGDSEWTSALGWGVGVDFMGLFNAVSTFSLTLGMRRLHGSDVELERPVVSNDSAVARKREVATNETIFMAGLCGRYDFETTE